MTDRGTRIAPSALLWRHRRRPPDWLVRWYFRHFIAPDRCPCSWRGFERRRWWQWLVYWCGRMDDWNERLNHLPFYAWVLNQQNTSSAAANVTVKWERKHG